MFIFVRLQDQAMVAGWNSAGASQKMEVGTQVMHRWRGVSVFGMLKMRRLQNQYDKPVEWAQRLVACSMHRESQLHRNKSEDELRHGESRARSGNGGAFIACFPAACC